MKRIDPRYRGPFELRARGDLAQMQCRCLDGVGEIVPRSLVRIPLREWKTAQQMELIHEPRPSAAQEA